MEQACGAKVAGPIGLWGLLLLISAVEGKARGKENAVFEPEIQYTWHGCIIKLAIPISSGK